MGRHLDRPLMVQILRRERMGVEHLLRRALEDHFSTLSARPRSDIDDPVGSPHHVLIVLHHDDRIAQVAERLERVDQSDVVALVESNARLVEDVEHIDQLRTDLRGQSDALALATRERGRLAVERQIVESDIQQKADALANLLDDLRGDLPLGLAEVVFHFPHPLIEFAQVHLREFGDILAPNLVGQSLAVQSLAVALAAGHVGDKLSAPFLSRGTLIALHDGPQILHYAVESHKIVRRRVDQFLGDAHLLERPIEDLVHSLLGNVLHGRLQVQVIFGQNRFYLPKYHLTLVFSKRRDRPLAYRLSVVGNHLLQVDLADHAKSLAMRTSPLGRVEGKDIGRRILVRQSRHGVHEALGEKLRLARVGIDDHHQSVALPHRRRHGLLQSLREVVLRLAKARGEFHLIDHHLDIVVLVAVGFHALGQFLNLPVYPYIKVALAPHALEEFAVVALTVADERSKDENLLAEIVLEDHRDHLFLGIFHHFLPALIGVGRGGAGKEQAEVVVDLRGRSDRGSRILVRRLLLNGDDGGEPRDFVHVGALHIAQEIAGIGRESLDIAALALGIDGVESQRRFARPAQAGEDRERVAGNDDINILQIVDARAQHFYFILVHRWKYNLLVCVGVEGLFRHRS